MNRHSQQHITFITSKHKTIITKPKIRAPNLQITITKPNRKSQFSIEKTCFPKHSVANTTHIPAFERTASTFKHRKCHIRSRHNLMRRNHFIIIIIFLLCHVINDVIKP
ncbi:hypothetical protein HanRHA438_Chr15g0719201 [Helianthus annuus]|nr:hypothetical protein HanRHA438_Chr15g0719201 [Helianthus annuus]